MRTRFSTLLGAGLFLLAADSARAQAPVPVGGEFQVNVVAGGTQRDSDVGMDADGDFVVVWRSFDGNLFGIFARRFSSSGVAQGGQFQVNTYTTELQTLPIVDLDADGDFVVVWQSNTQDGDLMGVFARRFSSAGAPLTGELMVNTTTANTQLRPSVAADSEGDFVVVWESYLQDGSLFGIFARRFNSAGIAQGGEFRANSFTPSNQQVATVDLDADGDFVVTWTSPQDGNSYGVFAQRFSAAGALVGPEFQVNTTFTGIQGFSSVGLDTDGDFVIVWNGPGGAGFGIFGQRFSSSGTPQGVEFPVNGPAATTLTYPRTAVDADGDFVVTWSDAALDGSGYGVFARRFKASGAPQNLDTRVNTTTSGDQFANAVATDADGDFVVSWTGAGMYPDIFAQRFDVPLTIDVDGDGQFLPLTDGLLLVRFGFGFTGATLITGAVGQGCTRCDAPSITAYLQSLV